MQDRIIELIKSNCALEEKEITAETKLNAISLDSLSFISLLVELETEFNIEFEDEELNIYDLQTVGDIINLTEGKTK